MEPRQPRYDALDLWRGVACLLVVAFHAGLYTRAVGPLAPLMRLVPFTAAGVPIFFVISGYCIAATADRIGRRSHRTRSFFSRRLRRIYPPYWGALAFAIGFTVLAEAIWPGILHDRDRPMIDAFELTPIEWLGNLTLTESWRHTLMEPGSYFTTLILGPAWSLCYEEQFYLVVGAIVGVRGARIFGAALVVTIATLGLLALPGVSSEALNGFFFDGGWFMFAAGVFVYWHLNYATRPQIVLVPAALVAALAYALARQDVLQAAAYAFSLLLLVARPFDAIVQRRWLAPLRFVGLRTYSIYLVHLPVVKLLSHLMQLHGLDRPEHYFALTLPASIALAILVGTGFYALVERRFLNKPSPLQAT